MNKTKPSKSAAKREYLALQKLGERLIGLSPEQLAQLELDGALRDAVRDAAKIRSHGALRRQKQLIGKLMRHVDPQPIQSMLDRMGRQDRQDKALFSRAEAWRDRIATEGRVALEAYCSATGGPDAELQALLSELESTVSEPGRKRIRRRMFRVIHGRLAGSGADDST
ncbi:MAG: DUF615 domain-containing protein [Gammaproteobacteria bacterium]|nr:DUF615 domain-containing protein [Gammaproteobacteria bacterium]